MDRSIRFTVVGSEAELLLTLLSPVVETVAVLVTVAAAEALTLTTRVIVLDPLMAIGPGFVQVTSCATAPQIQPVPVPETRPNPAGRVSVTVIKLLVANVPTLVTVSV